MPRRQRRRIQHRMQTPQAKKTAPVFGYIDIPAELRILLKWYHQKATEPKEQSIRGGTQFSLMNSDLKVIKSFLRRLTIELERLIPGNFEIAGVWSTSIQTGGRHIPHVHPKGWKSGVCYIDVPQTTSGLLKLGFRLEQTVVPQAGKIVLFPSWLPHATTEYMGETPRISVAFDLKVSDEAKIPLV